MANGPEPLWEGLILRDRYAIDRPLGRGGFGITYLAQDLKTESWVAVKELAPAGTTRRADGSVDFTELGPAVAQRLRHQFTHEAQLVARTTAPRVPRLLNSFHEFATGFLVLEYIADAITLEQALRRDGRFEADRVEQFIRQLLETLDPIHRHGILHRDIKPSNILWTPKEEPYLIDFGSARQWHADRTTSQTVLFTPHFAPPEQLSERARRGPGTDLYGLAATAYMLLTGEPPASPMDRVAGVPLIPVLSVRPDVPPGLASAIELALDPQLERRPANAGAFARLLGGTASDSAAQSVHNIDERLHRLARFRFDPRACPATGELLEEPKPLEDGICPVCRRGHIKERRIETKLCPSCRVGILGDVTNANPLKFCPNCHTGNLQYRKPGWFGRSPATLTCCSCEAKYEVGPEGLTDSEGDTKLEEVRRLESGRPLHVQQCDACQAQYDPQPDRRWRRMTEDRLNDGFTVLYPDEWGRVAAGLDPGCGNAECDACGADFFVDENSVTLLGDAGRDEYGFASRCTGRLIPRDHLPWVGIGKESGQPGLVCLTSGTEFDVEPAGWRLVRSDSDLLSSAVGQVMSPEDWHRFAQGLPAVGQESELESDLTDALLDSFATGELSLDPKNDGLLWRGRAVRLHQRNGEATPGKALSFQATTDGIEFGGFRKRFIDLKYVQAVEADEHDLWLTVAGEDEPIGFRLEPMVLSLRLLSGKTSMKVMPFDLARRLEGLLDRR